ncbi:MAG: branched-chain amino acid transport system II carrier protein [Clostridia bacterium]|nr:branched-chain amino acid transport system II carrier protein [Clostridia bacterium]
MKTNKLTRAQSLLTAFTLFGMFFGAGNMIFPVHLGQLAGSHTWLAILGFCVTAVTIPILGVAAIGCTHADGLHALSQRIGKRYGTVFTCLLYLTIGPFFAIPRCATVSFTTGIVPMLGEGSSHAIPQLIFSLVFFAIVLYCSLRPAKITVWIGKIINPLFLLFLAVLIVAALRAPGAAISAVEPAAGYENGAFFNALIEGYGTMDAIAGLAFGIIVVDIIRGMGVQEDGAVAKEVLRSGLLTGALMALIYCLTTVIGAQSRGLFELSANGGIAFVQIARHYLGTPGLAILAVTFFFACLKTALGLVTSCSEAFVRMFPNFISYRAWAVFFTIFSFAVSNIGLSAIINYSLPMLMFLYPLSITLILLALCGKFFGHDRRVYISVTACTLFAALFDLVKTLPASVVSSLRLGGMVGFAERFLPWFDLNLGWVVPALIGLAVGLILRAAKKTA